MLLRLAVVATVVLAQSLLSYSQTTHTEQQRGSIDRLRDGFDNPPSQARLRCYWWWLNGHTDKPTITHDLEQMKAKGFGGVLLVDAGGATQNGNQPVPAGPKFGSPAWTELYLHALKEADRLGLEVTLNIQSGWNVGGPSVTPADAAKLLTFDHLDIEGGHAQDLRIPVPPTVNNFYRDIAVLAYPLHHGTALAAQLPVARRHQHPANQETPQHMYPAAIRVRAVADEAGASMENTDSMLDDRTGTLFKNDSAYADAAVNEVRVLPMNADGSVHVQLPAGKWEILRVGYTDSGAKVSTSSDTWQGLVIDYMSRRAFDDYWNENVQPLLVAAKPYHSLKYLATDSWEAGGTNWTDDFREEFVKARGYDPVLYLPVVAGRILGNPSTSTRFLTDLRRTVADLVVKNHYDHFAAHAADFGLGVQSESGGPHVAPLDALETFRRSAVPQTEFWSQNGHRPTDSERFFVKEASSAVNIYGQPYAAAEGETSIGPQWSESIAADLKPAFDMAVTEGLNRLVWHEFTSSPASEGVPGQEYFAGTHLNPNVTWWNVGGPFFGYLNRVQYMMQQGHAVHDVLYFYGDQVPNFVRLKANDPAHALPGYDYDVTNQDALLRTIRIEGPELVGPSGVHWKMLVLPAARRVSIPVLEFIERYLKAGGTVVSLPPTSTTGNVPPAEQQKFDELTAHIWNDCRDGAHNYSKGTVYCTADARSALQQMKIVPDVEVASGDVRVAAVSSDAIDFVHRQVDGRSIYFVRSGYGEEKQFSLYLRAKGTAELWNPVSGNVYRATAQAADNHTKIDLQLPAFGSVFIVFPAKSTAQPAPIKVREQAAEGTWQLKVPGSAVIPLDGPRPWSEINAFRYFSGTATYTGSLNAPHLTAGETACLHFPQIHEIAKFHAADQDASIVWTYPYQFCVREFKSDRITLSIDVTNLWHNRLVGDAMQPAGRTTRTNIVLQPTDRSLLPSGLVGPAQWWIYSGR